MEANEENSGETPHSTNITKDEIDSETASKLRGDAIGDTMYSEVFVLNTLLQFSDLKWSSEVENDLCFLWDMTEEKDVCQYLFQVSYPTLACSAITKYNEPRFIEIVVGIFANLLCSKCGKSIKDDEIRIVIDLLRSDDPYILIQVMRFIHAISFTFEKLEFFEENHLDRFNFILYSSTNKELLTITLKALASITDCTKINANILKGELLLSAVTAYQALKDPESQSEYDLFESEEQRLNIKHLIQFVCNTCCYIDDLKVQRLVNELGLQLDKFTKEAAMLLNYFAVENNMLPMDEELKYYIEALTYIYRTLAVEYTSSIFIPVCKMFLVVSEKDLANLEVIAELLCYFISVGNAQSLIQDLKMARFNGIKDFLLDIQNKGYTFDFEYLGSLRTIINNL